MSAPDWLQAMTARIELTKRPWSEAQQAASEEIRTHALMDVPALCALVEALAGALEGFAFVGAERHRDRGHYYGCHYAVNGKRCAPHCAAARAALARYAAGPCRGARGVSLRVGMRVELSEKAHARGIDPYHPKRVGTVVGAARTAHQWRVRWDGLKTALNYHEDFLCAARLTP